jgi:hypothetical protein
MFDRAALFAWWSGGDWRGRQLGEAQAYAGVGERRLKSLRYSALILGSIASGPIPTANCIFFFHQSEAHQPRAGEE